MGQVHRDRFCAKSRSLSVVQRLGGAIEGVGENAQLLARAIGVFGVNGLIHSRNDHRRVPGVLARGKDGVFIPGAIGQTGGSNERRFRFPQGGVYPGGI